MTPRIKTLYFCGSCSATTWHTQASNRMWKCTKCNKLKTKNRDGSSCSDSTRTKGPESSP